MWQLTSLSWYYHSNRVDERLLHLSSGRPSFLKFLVCVDVFGRLTVTKSMMVLSLPSLSSSSSSSQNSAAALSINLKASSTVAESDMSGLLWQGSEREGVKGQNKEDV